MGHLHYYDALKDEIKLNTWLIVIIEAWYYCESENAKWIKRSVLKNRSNEMLNYFVPKTEFGGGAFGRLIRRLSDPLNPKLRFFKLDKKSRKDTRICPDIKRIKNEIEGRKKRNLENDNESLVRIRHKFDHLTRSMPFTDSVSIADSVGIAVTKAQAKTIPINGNK